MPEIPVNISPSRTYMVGVYDPNSENEIHFEKVILPEGAPNTIKSVKQHYLLDNVDEAENIRIMVCMSIEEYIGVTHNIFTGEEYINATRNMFTEKENEDIKSTLNMLYEWNAKQKIPFQSYSAALTALLQQVLVMNDFYDKLTKLKETILVLLEIEQ